MALVLSHSADSVHKMQMLRLLRAIARDEYLANTLVFKGGTCAALRGFLDRFSVDLDFDMPHDAKKLHAVRERLEVVFADCGLVIKDASHDVPQYFLKYAAPEGSRNTLKCEVTTLATNADVTELVRITDIDVVLRCHTVATMFAHKLCALIDRYERHGAIAGRDLYDIHTFFSRGYTLSADVIRARRGVEAGVFLRELADFVERHVTQTHVDQDINTLLAPEVFKNIRTHIVPEVIYFLRNA